MPLSPSPTSLLPHHDQPRLLNRPESPVPEMPLPNMLLLARLLPFMSPHHAVISHSLPSGTCLPPKVVTSILVSPH